MCVHFNGVQNKACKLGITYASVEAPRDKPLGGHHTIPCNRQPDRLPCVTSCSSYTEPTVEQLAEFQRALDARMAQIAQHHERGECSDCGVKITAVKQSGRCVYAAPCGHRIGQGDAKTIGKKYGVPVLA